MSYQELIDDCKCEIDTFDRPSVRNSKLLIEAVEELEKQKAELESKNVNMYNDLLQVMLKSDNLANNLEKSEKERLDLVNSNTEINDKLTRLDKLVNKLDLYFERGYGRSLLDNYYQNENKSA